MLTKEKPRPRKCGIRLNSENSRKFWPVSRDFLAFVNRHSGPKRLPAPGLNPSFRLVRHVNFLYVGVLLDFLDVVLDLCHQRAPNHHERCNRDNHRCLWTDFGLVLLTC